MLGRVVRRRNDIAFMSFSVAFGFGSEVLGFWSILASGEASWVFSGFGGDFCSAQKEELEGVSKPVAT